MTSIFMTKTDCNYQIENGKERNSKFMTKTTSSKLNRDSREQKIVIVQQYQTSTEIDSEHIQTYEYNVIQV